MPDSYMHAKIKEALEATGHDRHDAQKLLITWAVRDQQLLLLMAKPHLKAIAAALIEHATREKTDKSSGDGKVAETHTRTAIDDLVASAAVHMPLEKRRKSNVPPPKSTERQASAMRRLAAAFRKKDE